jgi:glycosyltransferase involved in cell wall biosynthesis
MGSRINEGPEVVFFQRKPRSVGNYSVEYIFEDVRKRLRNKLNGRVVISKYESKGLLPRLYNVVEAYFKRGIVNHITGDVNYLGLFLSNRNTVNTILDCVHLNSSKGVKYKILKYFWLSIPERRARFITAISESTKREILKHHRCDPDKIVVIYVAISPQFKFRHKEFNRAKPRILQVGTAPNKNIPRLIEALRGIPCTLNIIGKRNEEYEQLCRLNSVDLVYESGLSDEDMVLRYEEADVVSLISTYEGFGMPILEAQAVGRAVITSNVYSMPEVAGDSAVIVDPADIEQIREAFLKIINDDKFRNERIEEGLLNIKRFDPDKIADDYYDLYMRIYSENKARN